MRTCPRNVSPTKPAGVVWLAMAVAVSTIVAGVPARSAWAQQRGEGEDRVLATRDNWQIHITYFKSTLGREAPVVLALHNIGGNRLVWHDGFAQKLNEAGFAVVTVDLRKHGQSTTVADADNPDSKKAQGDVTDLSRDDVVAMLEDLKAVKRFLCQEHNNGELNIRKTAVVAAESTVPLAIAFAEYDRRLPPHTDAPTLAARTPRGQDVQAVVMLSPDESYKGLSSTKSLQYLRTPQFAISFLVCVGSKDNRDRGQSNRIFRQVSGITQNRDRTYRETYNVQLRGTDLLSRDLRVEDHILTFLERHLKELEGDQYEWKDRVPKTGRTCG